MARSSFEYLRGNGKDSGIAPQVLQPLTPEQRAEALNNKLKTIYPDQMQTQQRLDGSVSVPASRNQVAEALRRTSRS